MNILSGSNTASMIENLIHDDTQVHQKKVDLTVSEVYKFSTPGQLDFGGGEYKPAECSQMETEKKHADDDYGWWQLAEGTFKLQFNETIQLDEGNLGLIQPHPRLLNVGAHHPTLLLLPEEIDKDSPFIIPFTVDSYGCNLKENCRTSQLLVLENPNS